ncbi:MAG: AbrB/MazE/SpoVT family DNA-binding domain-containing protein [Deltaproteobacteria bacterium]|nr:AbrB/MazE/SpoVT family DNA-binding domain-containing protein [Deltaproteobacteria bacterium]MBW2612982.1 AbrB/MazE/SpoVT family DNA-binding domain-containing protein [Deltaproteobacteria bacterium]MBW2634710.1 AbrB/MazE/SpoVT family DNA-binding domain-containing protein [Deltaproteobacteria bacterium]MBW2676625.1 AbrB/MazE/SpoVT family DNA-binding domain-containing protein [Deltaproteobacteria bacterium]
MRVTTKGQVTIPQHIREKLMIYPATEIDFIEEKGRVFLVKRKGKKASTRKFAKLRGIATVNMTTDEIMSLTRVDR